MPYPPYGKLLLVFFVVLFILLAVGLYLMCLVAVHVTIALLSLPSERPGSVHPRTAAVAIGLTSGLIWALIFLLGIIAAMGRSGHWAVGTSVGLIAGSVIGWQVTSWQEARSWTQLAGSLNLGSFRGGPFFVSRPYAVTPTERLKHVVCSGPTGSGKSTLLRNMILQDIRAGTGLCVIDPKDDLIDDLLSNIPHERMGDVILFDATDRDCPLGLNPLAEVPPDQRSLAASELIAVFKRYFSDAWGPRLEHILRHVTLALLDMPGATLLDIPRVLLDRAYASAVADQSSNPAVREFFRLELPDLARGRGTTIGPILNKVGPWLAYPELRSVIGQERNSFELREVMDSGKILFVRIPQGGIGEDASSLLGSLLVAKVQLAAQSRVDVPVHSRRPFYLYVDEFQNFTTTSFAKIVTEARGFGLGLVCANQFPEQLPRDLQLTLVNNAATFVVTEHTRGSYLARVTRREDAARGADQGFELRPLSPLPMGDSRRAEAIREMSRERYGSGGVSESSAITSGPQPEAHSVNRSGWGEDMDEE